MGNGNGNPECGQQNRKKEYYFSIVPIEYGLFFSKTTVQKDSFERP